MPVTVKRQLPALDAVIISHDHYDHLDYPTILQMVPLDVPFYTSLGVGAHLQSWGVPAERIVELDWWECVKLPHRELSITAAPSQHFSGRGLGDRNTTSWSSFAVMGPRRHSFFFSGDTGLTTEYAAIRERLGPFDLVMLEIGAFHPAWGDIHLGPENALEALGLLGGGWPPASGRPSTWRRSRLGRAGRDAGRAGAEKRCSPDHAEAGRARRAGARRRHSRSVVARRREKSRRNRSSSDDATDEEKSDAPLLEPID